ncbi:shikimate O-hydroxycinnamoyltransferase [Sesamum indicum]|uniref:Shikimate O-hydroxycinnamoyltransferase n=1 Tax=Sesamum indicum TaxID=4182 RepID=A0A6I9SLA0_SESIN|nr:shikimate O-hydroxycinnamoyltransferase [Sesamum indicum]
MASQDAFHGIFEVEVVRKTVVKAAGPVPESHVISLSNLDLLSGRFPVTYIYFYRRTHSSSLIRGSLKESLAQCLSHFYPFAGRISENPKSGEPEIICDNSGALVVEAQASISLDEFDFYNLNKSLQGKLISVNHQFPVQVQITNYIRGGISMTFTFDHALGDATAFSKFLVTWSEIAMKKPISCSPDHSRSLRARFPPTYDPSLDEEFVSCTMEEICNIPAISILLKRLYYIDESSINRLQRLASANGNKRTKIEAFSAYIWKVMANAIDKNHEFCKIGWLVDGRSRLSKCQNSMSNYIGNVLSLAFGESNVADLKKGSIAGIADIIHKAISTVTNEAHFRNLIDWVECHRPGLMISKNVLGLGGPALVISSGRRFPVAELDFGFGNPVLGTVSSTIEGLGVGYINQRQSAGADGSWTVSAILWPEMVEALESDPNHIFQPMNLNHIQL